MGENFLTRKHGNEYIILVRLSVVNEGGDLCPTSCASSQIHVLCDNYLSLCGLMPNILKGRRKEPYFNLFFLISPWTEMQPFFDKQQELTCSRRAHTACRVHCRAREASRHRVCAHERAENVRHTQRYQLLRWPDLVAIQSSKRWEKKRVNGIVM